MNHKWLKCFFLVFSFFCSLSTTSTVMAQADQTTSVTSINDPEVQYKSAIQDAKINDLSRIDNHLTSITPANHNLRWKMIKGTNYVLVVRWTGDWTPAIGSILHASGPPDGGDIWVTAVPDLQKWCQNHSILQNTMESRLLQLLGIDPAIHFTNFIEYWVKPADLYRPAAQQDVTTTEVTELGNPPFGQVTSHVGWSQNYYNWFEGLYNNDFEDGGPNKLHFPWTRLGYTYDWGTTQPPHIGLSEFVIRSGAVIHVAAVADTWSYCTRMEDPQP